MKYVEQCCVCGGEYVCDTYSLRLWCSVACQHTDAYELKGESIPAKDVDSDQNNIHVVDPITFEEGEG